MRNIVLFIGVCVSIITSSCQHKKGQVVILSKASNNYIQWMKKENVIILDAYTISNTDSILSLADGIILTGGEDINPLMYNDSANLKLCEKINYKRDTLEKKLFDYAFRHKIPLIGVCRGMQMMNVATGGTLYGDIPTEIGTTVVHRNNGEVNHKIVANINTSVYQYLQKYPNKQCGDNATSEMHDLKSCIFPINKDTFIVNSWHHQGLKKVSDVLHVVAESLDGLAEAVVVDKDFHPFMIAVQFHPERLGSTNPIHQKMKENFYKAIEDN